jgi:hypothetical protein
MQIKPLIFIAFLCFILLSCSLSGNQNNIQITQNDDSCTEQYPDSIDSVNLEGSKWIYHFKDCQDDTLENCTDFVLFKENKQFLYFTSEDGDTVYGKYEFEDSILILHAQHSVYDDDFPIGSEHRYRYRILKCKIWEKKMFFIEIWFLNTYNIWEKVQYEIPGDYFFTKID